MIIIAGYELVNAKDRDGYVAAFRGLVTRAREFDGCIHVAITADSVDPERIDTVEVWRDAEALNEWRKRARAPRMKEPKHSAVRRYDATDGGPLF
jgi:quinol monooxygenase YgiN